mgnify:CR=1 FL=1
MSRGIKIDLSPITIHRFGEGDGIKVCADFGIGTCCLLSFERLPYEKAIPRLQELGFKIEWGQDVGADAYVTKPFDAVTLLEKINHLLK